LEEGRLRFVNEYCGNRWNKRRDAARMNDGNIEGSWPVRTRLA